MPKLIQATIETLDGDQAVLKFEDGTTAQWPAKQLPDGAKQGSIIHMLGSDEHAKTILNELLEEES